MQTDIVQSAEERKFRLTQGQIINTHKLVVNPIEAESVKLIFEMYAEGYGYSPILERLHDENRLTDA